MIIDQKDYVTPKNGLVLRYKGTFDFKKLYNSSKEWFDKLNYDFNEKEYNEKPTAAGTEFKLVFEAKRDINEFISFQISPTLHFFDVKKSDGKNYGKIKIKIPAYILLDKENKWQSNPFKKFLFFFYCNFTIRKEIENVYEDKLYSEVLDFINTLKKFIRVR